MIEEKVIEQTPETSTSEVSTPPAPPVNDLAKQLQEANERAAKAEALADQQRKAAEEAEQKFKNAKSKIGQYYDDRNKALEDQGMYKPLWEEANKTNQEMQNEVNNLKQQIQDLQNSNEAANTKQEALAAISNLGAINAEQTLSLLQGKLQKNAEGKVVVLMVELSRISIPISAVLKILVVVGNIISNLVVLLEWVQNQVLLQMQEVDSQIPGKRAI
tara:strand:- start:166 stop:816 length:651 start_codon:yes stop_codon:yes gene_type:complete